ncbi:hypothetical protein KAR48_10350 [bacterium]|nr:hypothetical protein [bacterium]
MKYVRYIQFPLVMLAIAGLAFSLQAHVAGYLVFQPPLGSSTWFQLNGVVVLLVPMIFITRYLARGYEKPEFWKAVLRGCPQWMKYTIVGIFLYAFINFMLSFILPLPTQPGIENIPLNRLMRGFSVHWMAFYGLAVGVFYSALKTIGSDNSSDRIT